VIIRPATVDDSKAIVEMGLKFHASSPYVWMRATEQSITELCGLVFALERGAVILLAVEDGKPFGMLAGALSKHLVTGQIFADEIVWWVDPAYRGSRRAGPALLCSFKEWARERGCSMLKMIAPNPSLVGEFYERQGFRLIEQIYVLEL
jgi:GNAT superfamily N-acetyltransferase